MTFEELYSIIIDRKKNAVANSYVSKLFASGRDRIIQKVGEEAVEVIIAAKNSDKKEIVSETSDLIMHLFVMLADADVSIDDILGELQERHQAKIKKKKN